MANDDIAATRLKTIETQLRSTATCTATTVAELRDFLSGETTQSKKENIRAKPTKANNAQSATRRRPGTANAAKTEQAADSSTTLISPRRRYVLATQAVNATLQSLADVLKTPVSQRTAQSPPDSKSTVSTATVTHKTQRPGRTQTKSTSVSNRPLKERSASQVTNSPKKPKSLRRSSSYSTFTGIDAGVVAAAECARLAFAYLDTTEGTRFLGKDSPGLALENGRLSLIGKLVTHGLDNLAVKEMRTLKKRLDTYNRRLYEKEKSDTLPNGSSLQEASKTEKENLAALLDFGNFDFDSAALPIIINLQIYVLRVLGKLKRPRYVEAAWDYLKLSHPSNPANLISHTAKDKSNHSKAARQLESLAQTILHLCPSISSAADDEEQSHASPDVVLCLQHLAFGIRQRWWSLAQHEGDKDRELIEPFGKCLVAYARRSSLPAVKKYRIAEALYANLLGTANDTDYSQRDTQSPYVASNSTLASLARAAGLPDEALRWLSTCSASISKESSTMVTIRSVRIAAVSLEAALKNGLVTDQQSTIDAALESVTSALDGTAKDLETLLIEVHSLRRAATRVLSSRSPTNTDKFPATLHQQCVRIITASIRFSRRFIGSRPDDDASAATLKTYEERLAKAAKLAKDTVESVTICCRQPLISESMWDEIDTLLQDCLHFWLQLEQGSVYFNGVGTAPEEAAKPISVKFSNVYWTLRRHLQELESHPHPALKAMHRSTTILLSRPQAEKEDGQLSLKLERLGDELDKLDQVNKSRQAYSQSICAALDTGLCGEIIDATSNHIVTHVFGSSQRLSDLGRALMLYHRSFIKHGLSTAEELAFYDDSGIAAAARGALLEWQLELYQQTLSKHRNWNAPLSSSLDTMVNRLLSIYTPAQFPMRRQRLQLVLLQLSYSFSSILSSTHILHDTLHRSDVDISRTMDQGLTRYQDHLGAMATLKTVLHQSELQLQELHKCFRTWRTLLQQAKTWAAVTDRVDNTDHWMESIEASVDLLCAKGEDYEALPILHLLVQILELRNSSDASQLVLALVAMALLLLRIGYSGKAGQAFAKAKLLVNKAVSVGARLRWHVGYAEYLLSIGKTSEW